MSGAATAISMRPSPLKSAEAADIESKSERMLCNTNSGDSSASDPYKKITCDKDKYLNVPGRASQCMEFILQMWLRRLRDANGSGSEGERYHQWRAPVKRERATPRIPISNDINVGNNYKLQILFEERTYFQKNASNSFYLI